MKTILVSPKVCYVCNKNIKSMEWVYIGHDNYRHTHCAPGTARWLNSRHVQSSPYRDLWKAGLTGALKTGEISPPVLYRGKYKKIRHIKSDSRQMTLF